MDFIHSLAKYIGISGEAAIQLLFGAVLLFIVIRIITSDNPIKPWHFFGWQDPVTKEWRGDVDNAGRVVGAACAVFVIFWTTYKHNYIVAIPWSEVILIVLCLIYLGGISAFSSWLRGFADRRYAPDAKPAPELPAAGQVQREVKTSVTDTTTLSPEAAK